MAFLCLLCNTTYQPMSATALTFHLPFRPAMQTAILAVLSCLLLIPVCKAQSVPLGPLGVDARPVPGTGLLEITNVSVGAPAHSAGIQEGDFLHSAGGRTLGITSTNTNDGYVGAVQDIAIAIDRAEGGDGQVALGVIRPGVGGLQVVVNVGVPGSLGPAWPAGSDKADAIYETAVSGIHNMVAASSNGNFGHMTGWFGLILLSHPAWDQTTGLTPYYNSIQKLRIRCENYLNSRELEPSEAFIYQNGVGVSNPNYINPGLENWDVTMSALFLALYRIKSGDSSADAIVQRAAEMIAHRIQHWTQINDPPDPPIFGGARGRMGHGGVHGDYSHYGNGAGALNIINAHAMPALALLKMAGADMDVNLGESINDFYASDPISPTIEDKFRISWEFMKECTTIGGGDDGNVGYMARQSGWDSAGRTPGVLAGWYMYGLTPDADDLDKLARQESYTARRWYRQLHAHAYTIGGVALSQFAMPFMSERHERFFQENTRMFPVLSRRHNGSIAYFPGRQNNGGDDYLNFNRVAHVNAAIAGAIRSGRLPGFPAPDSDRLHIEMNSPYNDWPHLEARRAELRGGLSHSLEMRVTDADGVTIPPADHDAQWTHVSGPGTVVFGSPQQASTTVTVPQHGTYRVAIEVERNGHQFVETYDLEVSPTASDTGTAPFIVNQPQSVTTSLGGNATFTISAQGTSPLIYQWMRNGQPVGAPSTSATFQITAASAGSIGTYECVVTNAHGSVVSQPATLTVSGVGGFEWGGLWRDVYTGIPGTQVADLTSADKFPYQPDSSGVLETPDAPVNIADNYGQRWSGWVTPPETGNYRFYIASDDASELWLSTDGTRANRQRIAQFTSWTSHRSWSTGAQSALIPLVGGQRYYIEVLHKEGGGADHCAITWNWRAPGVWAMPPNGSEPLPGAILEYQVGGTFDDQITPPADYPPIAHGQSITVFGGESTAITLTGEDFEGAPLSFEVVSGPTKGSLTGTLPSLTYTPTPGASGTDSFTFRAFDGGLYSEPATVTIGLIPEEPSDIRVWLGSLGGSWDTAGNWLSNNPPGSNQAALFDNRSTGTLNTSLNANTSIRRLVVADVPGTVSISSHTLTISDGISMHAATANLQISSALSTSAAQEWAVGGDRTLTASGPISGSQPLEKSGAGTLVLMGVSPASAPWTVSGGTLELRGGGWYQGHVGGSGNILVKNGATLVNVNAHSFGSGNNPNRSITLDGGRFLLERETYIRDLNLTGGLVGNVPGHNGNVASRSSGSVVSVLPSLIPSEIFCRFNAVGPVTFNVADSPDHVGLTMHGPLVGSGSATKTGGGRMVLLSSESTHTGSFNLSGGEIAIIGSITSTPFSVQNGARLSGTGSIAGQVNHTGQIEPGHQGGVAILSLGSLAQNPSADTRLKLGGAAPGSGHDQILVSGSAQLGGVLEVTLMEGYEPGVGDVFRLVEAGSRSGSFASVTLPDLPEGYSWTEAYDHEGVPGFSLIVEIEPGVPVPLHIEDPAFNDTTLNSGSWSHNIHPWQETDGPGNTNGFLEHISGFAALPPNHLGMALNHDVWQDLGATYQPNTRYTLTVATGNRSGWTSSSNESQYHLGDSNGSIHASGSANASQIPVGQFADAPPLVFDTTNHPEVVGQTIRIVLRARGAGRSHFDHVRLTAQTLAPTPFVQWQEAWFGPNAHNPEIAGPHADPDGDGIPNLMEYALALNPSVPLAGDDTSGHAGRPALDPNPDVLALIYRQNMNAPDIAFQVEHSADLGATDPWTPAPVVETVLAEENGVRVIHAAMPLDGHPRGFLRLRVSK